MLMKPKIYLKSESNFAVLRWNAKSEVWQVFAYYNYALDALSIAVGLCRADGSEMVLAERGVNPILIRGGMIVSNVWRELEVIWLS